MPSGISELHWIHLAFRRCAGGTAAAEAEVFSFAESARLKAVP